VSTSAKSVSICAPRSWKRSAGHRRDGAWARDAGHCSGTYMRLSRSPVPPGLSSGQPFQVGCHAFPTRLGARQPGSPRQRALPRSRSRWCIPRVHE
jgi:hypothetical protein